MWEQPRKWGPIGGGLLAYKLSSVSVRMVPFLVRNLHDLKRAIANIAEYPAYVIDVETTGLNPRTNLVTWVGLASYGQVYMIPIGHTIGRKLRPAYSRMELPHEDDRVILQSGKLSTRKVRVQYEAMFAPPPTQLDPGLVFKELEPLLFSGKIIIGHNVKFDVQSMAKYYGGAIPDGPYEDTLVMTHITDENRRTYELKDTVLDWFRIRNLEARKRFYPKLAKTITTEPIDAVARYLAKDAYLDWLLWKQRRRELDREGLMKVLKLEMDIYPAIIRMEMNGTAVDTETMNEIGEDLSQELDHLEEQVWTIVGEPVEMTNVARKRDLLFGPKTEGGQNLAPLSVTAKTAQPQLTQAVLEHYAGRNDLARLFLSWSEAQKVHSTYIVGLQKRTQHVAGVNYVHTNFTQHGTVTGRLSSRDPNIQNIPRESEIRALFISEPGRVLIVADYDQIELRVLAHFCKDPTMLAIFARGEDIHAGTTAALLDLPLEEVTKEMRQIGKTINFAVVYGAGPAKVAAQARVSMKQAKTFLDAYNQRFPMVGKWKRHVVIEAHRRGIAGDFKHPPYVTTLLGRRRRLPGLYSADFAERGYAERQAVNYRVQGTAAEIMKLAVIRLDRVFLGTPGRMHFTVHDELVSSAPEGWADEAKGIVVAAMSGITMRGKPIIDVPLEVTCGVGTRWSEAKG